MLIGCPVNQTGEASMMNRLPQVSSLNPKHLHRFTRTAPTNGLPGRLPLQGRLQYQWRQDCHLLALGKC